MNTDKDIIHQCDKNFYDDIEIKYQKINVEQESWVIDYIWRAKDGEVDDGFAEKIGEIIMMDMILISFCPFCGSKLIDQKKNTW